MLFAGPHELGCDDCPANLPVDPSRPDLATIGLAFEALLYDVLFVVVLVRLTLRTTQQRAGTVEVTDDGVGGADAARGSGLRGLTDRVAVLDGTLSVDSAAGRGTRLHVEMPCEPPADR